MRKLTRFFAAALAIAAIALPASVVADDKSNVTITVSDTGYSPQQVDIYPGMTVFWTNSGTRVHTATTKSGPVPFDTGGIAPTQTVSINFTTPGAYAYTSATDCTNPGGGPQGGFDCGTAIVHVIDPSIPVNNAPPDTPTPGPTATPIPPGPPQSVTVHITSAGMDQPSVTLAMGGSVTFINDDVVPHTATSTGGGNPIPFDTGGIGPGLSASFGFTAQGTYTYTSATDCLNGGGKAGFNCGPYKIVVVGQTSALAPGTVVTPTSGGANPTVTIDEAFGFSPTVIQIHPGQTVTWINKGSKVHSVVSNPGYPQQFDSGGLDSGKQFSFTFNTAGQYDYHSSTEPNYGTDIFGATVVTDFALKGTVLVQ